jgi:hypothetical protein
MKPSRAREVPNSLLRQRWPAFIWGQPGVGKSAIVRDIAVSSGLPVLIYATDGYGSFWQGSPDWSVIRLLSAGPVKVPHGVAVRMR